MNHPTAKATEAPSNLRPVLERLRALLDPYRDRMHLASDGPDGMTLDLPGYQHTPWGFAAGVRLGKRYVSYYLMGVYGAPELLAGMSPELRRRMQGKSCFNFTRIDEPLFAELAALTEQSIARQPAVVDAALAKMRRKR